MKLELRNAQIGPGQGDELIITGDGQPLSCCGEDARLLREAYANQVKYARPEEWPLIWNLKGYLIYFEKPTGEIIRLEGTKLGWGFRRRRGLLGGLLALNFSKRGNRRIARCAWRAG